VTSQRSVIVERPETPLLWLDTSFLIALGRAEKDAERGDRRVLELVDLIDAKRQEDKLVCVESDQAQEVGGHPQASRIRLRLRKLTYNIQLRARLDLDHSQVAEAMRAYLVGDHEIRLKRRVFFRGDPDATVQDVSKQGWFISVDMGMHPDLLARAKQAKERTHEDVEALRQKNRAEGTTYEQQLERERRGFLEGQRVILERLRAQLLSPEPDYMLVAAGSPLRDYLRTWAVLGGDPDQAMPFFLSEHFLALPCNDIPFRLYAQILTIDRPAEPGDAMDIQHMAAALPIATWVLTDKSLANRVRQLGLDRAWGSKVYALRTVDGLRAELEAL